MKLIIFLLIATVLISGCDVYNTFYVTEPEEIELAESKDDFCKRTGGISFNNRCNTLWSISFEDIDLKLIDLYSESTYELRDGEKQICTKINEMELICEPKMLKYNFESWEAKLTYDNDTINCYFINDSYEFETRANHTTFKFSRYIEIEEACSYSDTQTPSHFIKRRYCGYDTPILCILRYY